MKLNRTVAAVTAVLALSVAPGLALASQAPDNPGNAQGPPATVPPTNPGTAHNQANPSNPGPNASMPAKAKAYGKLCQGQSKKHVAGMKGTPFSQCVTAMAKAAHGTNPTTACKAESKKHVKGEKGTPYSRCVSAAAKLQNDQQQS
jgi:hypothetical protein